MVGIRTGAALALLSACFLLTDGAACADPAPQPTATPLTEIGRVTTAGRHEESIDHTTRTAFVVTQAQMQARGDRTIADAVQDVPGVEIYRYGAFGSQTTIFIRGAATTNVLVLLDGVPLSPASSEEIDSSSLSTSGVRSVEIVEGTGSTLYGSSAVGGVINILTSVPRGAYLEVADGSLGDSDLRAGIGNGKLGVSFERHIASNEFAYPALPQPGGTPIPAGTRSNADTELTAARISYDADLGREFSARLRLGTEQQHLGAPGSLTYGADDFSRENTSRADAHLDISHTTPHSSTTLTLSGSRQNLDYVDPSAYVSPALTGIENPTLDGRAQVSLEQIVSAGDSTFVGGIDLARESAVLANIATYDANFNYLGNETTGVRQSQNALYAQEQYAYANGVRWSAGLRAENDAPLGGAITPSLGVAVPLAPGLRVVANAGTSFRAPTIVDRYYPGYANPGLTPERSKDADLSLQSSALLGGASIGFFARDTSDLIQLDSNFVPQNVARASVRGILATLRTRPYHGYVSTLSVTDTYKAQNLSPGATQTRLLFAPVIVTKLGLERGFGNGAFAYGAQANVFGPHQEGTGYNNDGQTTVDAYLRERLHRDAVLSLRVNNLGNERYQPVLGYPAVGRTFVVELSTR